MEMKFLKQEWGLEISCCDRIRSRQLKLVVNWLIVYSSDFGVLKFNKMRSVLELKQDRKEVSGFDL